MATYEKYMNAARNADAEEDEAAATLARICHNRAQTTQEPEVEEESKSVLVALARLVDLRWRRQEEGALVLL